MTSLSMRSSFIGFVGAVFWSACKSICSRSIACASQRHTCSPSCRACVLLVLPSGVAVVSPNSERLAFLVAWEQLYSPSAFAGDCHSHQSRESPLAKLPNEQPGFATTSSRTEILNPNVSLNSQFLRANTMS